MAMRQLAMTRLAAAMRQLAMTRLAAAMRQLAMTLHAAWVLAACPSDARIAPAWSKVRQSPAAAGALGESAGAWLKA